MASLLVRMSDKDPASPVPAVKLIGWGELTSRLTDPVAPRSWMTGPYTVAAGDFKASVARGGSRVSESSDKRDIVLCGRLIPGPCTESNNGICESAEASVNQCHRGRWSEGHAMSIIIILFTHASLPRCSAAHLVTRTTSGSVGGAAQAADPRSLAPGPQRGGAR